MNGSKKMHRNEDSEVTAAVLLELTVVISLLGLLVGVGMLGKESLEIFAINDLRFFTLPVVKDTVKGAAWIPLAFFLVWAFKKAIEKAYGVENSPRFLR
ncbi:hypothetical protein [Coxiella burnetii]|uniref:Uncharacterized protein n=1 Tax=Coxiella burnetii (strain Dugway 5J108-111) TaxID=434922 RepID=A9KGD4_COXBN|nr:hypothetical protein [Coxiella burnetii]ABS77365.2 hypothetical protein CBUD_1429 [Coxiella burnetii Dugway 5J108-111]ACJ18071.1 hypothetical protein CbuG_0668 [Coxiella burnetii CbuG_Q212]ATN66474.1 hypothetical protein AYM17_03170 [Coxiella burnetii]ATN74747.1 hypothetical protein AYM90_07050 [Coxiella burnetii]ATN76650.1 hypothetical protein AYM94_07050 [Coxiella burnetii]